jgi:GntR family transcriptional regulator/MocR family aminotransferase
MRAWDLNLSLDTTAGLPVFLKIARAISNEVRRHRLRPGDPLPGSRTLAKALQVHRNTVVSAYVELLREGWIETRRAGGTFVSRTFPDVNPRGFAPTAPRLSVPARAGFDLRPILHREESQVPRGTLNLASGVPDPRLLPAAALSRAYRRALRYRGPSVLDYGDARGHPRLRSALAKMVCATRGLAATADSLVVTRGAQMAFDLAARALLSPGDTVAVEELGYSAVWTSLTLAGARLVPVSVDAEGLRVDALERIAVRESLRAIYLTPHHQYPTMTVLSPARRLQLLDLARRHRFAIIEDDYDHEFHYQGRPVLPLASADQAGVVIYVGTLSKILAPGLRLGFIVAPQPLLDRVVQLRTVTDRQGDLAVECAVAEMLEDGEVQRHVRRMRRTYESRRSTLVVALRTHLGSALSFEVPSGGVALWVRVAPDIDVDRWAERALSLKVAFAPGSEFAFDRKPRPNARLVFSRQTEAELQDAVRRMAAALRTTRAGSFKAAGPKAV